MTRYTVRPARPAGSVFWNVALVVAIIAGIGAVAFPLAVAVVTLALVVVLAVALVRAGSSGRR
ncbi:UNVERIFIED_ORG: hypothetical protein E4P37_03375 [Bacillus sp. AZ43]